jgi:hypothetical protein
MFPSQYLSGADLNGKSYNLTINRVVVEEIFDMKKNKKVKKWVIYFKDAKKGCLCGKTQATEIFDAVGLDKNTDGSEKWIGKTVEVYPTEIKAFGEIHVVPRFRKPTKTASEAPPAAMQEESVVDDDEPEGVGDAHEGPVDQDNPLGIR